MDRIENLTTPEQVDAFLAKHERAVIFKAGVCHKTPASFVHVESRLGPREDIRLGVIRVVEARRASNRVAEISGVIHESPQVLLFRNGRAVFDLDNWDITAADIEDALVEHFPEIVARS